MHINLISLFIISSRIGIQLILTLHRCRFNLRREIVRDVFTTLNNNNWVLVTDICLFDFLILTSKEPHCAGYCAIRQPLLTNFTRFDTLNERTFIQNARRKPINHRGKPISKRHDCITSTKFYEMRWY